MALRFREFQPGDREAVWAIWQDAFVGDHAELREDWFEHPEATLLVWEDEGRILGTVRVHRFGATRLGAVIPCGGLAVVAVDVAHRRGGLGHRILEDALAWMRAEGTPLSSLYAFREGWYRRLGYEVSGVRWRISAPTHRLPDTGAELPIRTVAAEDWRQLQPVHEAFCRRYSGMNPRSEARWMRVLKPGGKENTILIAGDPAEAYAVMRLAGEEAAEQPVAEVAWSSPRGYAALLAILKQVGINHRCLLWYEPGDSPFLASHMDSEVSAELARPIMFRLTDVPSALRYLKPAGKGSVTLEVEDELIPENRGPFRIEWSDGVVSVSATEEASVRAPIGAFTQAFLGHPCFADLVTHGRIAVQTEEALDAMNDLLPPCPVYCMEFF